MINGTSDEVNIIQYQNNKNEYQKELPEPISGWDATWKSLVDKGILDLPDATEIDCNDNGYTDGDSLIVEYKVNRTYRTYKYDNPSRTYKYDNPRPKKPRCSEAKQISEIYKIIKDEFRFIEFNQ